MDSKDTQKLFDSKIDFKN